MSSTTNNVVGVVGVCNNEHVLLVNNIKSYVLTKNLLYIQRGYPSDLLQEGACKVKQTD